MANDYDNALAAIEVAEQTSVAAQTAVTALHAEIEQLRTTIKKISHNTIVTNYQVAQVIESAFERAAHESGKRLEELTHAARHAQRRLSVRFILLTAACVAAVAIAVAVAAWVWIPSLSDIRKLRTVRDQAEQELAALSTHGVRVTPTQGDEAIVVLLPPTADQRVTRCGELPCIVLSREKK